MDRLTLDAIGLSLLFFVSLLFLLVIVVLLLRLFIFLGNVFFVSGRDVPGTQVSQRGYLCRSAIGQSCASKIVEPKRPCDIIQLDGRPGYPGMMLAAHEAARRKAGTGRGNNGGSLLLFLLAVVVLRKRDKLLLLHTSLALRHCGCVVRRGCQTRCVIRLCSAGAQAAESSM